MPVVLRRNHAYLWVTGNFFKMKSLIAVGVGICIGIPIAVGIPIGIPIAVGIFYRPPNSNDFLNLLSNSFQQIDLNKKEIYLLGDFNINLFQNGKFLLKENQSNQVKDPTSPLISKYKKFCQSFFFDWNY